VISAAELIELVLDEDAFESWDLPIDTSSRPDGYRAELADAASRAGTDESVITGRGLLDGRPVVVIVNEFRFLGGSIGQDAARRIVSAVERATIERLPVLASTASGGTRMQEGAPAFMTMIDISRAVTMHRDAGLPFLTYLRHPTTGGAFASWGSLGQLTTAEPEALVGFLGPKVFEAMYGRAFPPGIQAAENLARRGVIDGIIPPERLAHMAAKTLSIVQDPPIAPEWKLRDESPDWMRTTWQAVEATRSQRRATVHDVLEFGCSASVRLSGTGQGENSAAVVVALARMGGQPCVVVGQDIVAQKTGSALGPESLRAARRGMALANELRLPLVTLIDTAGAELSEHAENGSLAGEIARCLATMTTMQVPVVSVLLGQGCGGGALALLPADRVICLELAWLSPLPPEGASAIVYGDSTHAATLVEEQHIGARDLQLAGLVDTVLAEKPHDSVETLARTVATSCAHHLSDLLGEDDLDQAWRHRDQGERVPAALTRTGGFPLGATTRR